MYLHKEEFFRDVVMDVSSRSGIMSKYMRLQ